MRHVVVAALVLMLAACAGTRQVVVHDPVEVVRYVYVPIRADLTNHPASVPEPRNSSGEELLRVARERKNTALQCFGQLDAISAVQGTPVPTAAQQLEQLNSWLDELTK